MCISACYDGYCNEIYIGSNINERQKLIMTRIRTCVTRVWEDLALGSQSLNEGLNRLGWALSKYGDDGEVCSVEKDVKLAAAVQQQGKITLGGFDYTLSGNGKWIVRHPARQ